MSRLTAVGFIFAVFAVAVLFAGPSKLLALGLAAIGFAITAYVNIKLKSNRER